MRTQELLSDTELTTAMLRNPQRGHVFVVLSDLTKLSCDAWMLPTDDQLVVEKSWGTGDMPIPAKPKTWENRGQRVLRVPEFSRLCQPFLVNVGGIKLPVCDLCKVATAMMRCDADNANLCSRCDEKMHNANPLLGAHKRDFCVDIRWYIDGARQFFKEVSQHLKGTAPLHNRAKHLVCLPLVGTGMGGAGGSAGGVVALLIPELYRAANQYNFDVSLVLNDRVKFAAVQLLRNRFEHAWGLLSEGLQAEARTLADHARDGNLVLFLGSGISTGAGLPTWSTLLQELAKEAGMSVDEQATLESMNNLDAARIIEMNLGGGEALARAVAKRCAVTYCSQNSCLLAGLPVKEAVTTNYNQMFEMASAGAGVGVAVLPYAPATKCDRWLLKMHGCTSHPKDIVLTREDYLRYANRRSALQGIVQSLLITRHMLFVGFSLNDDNFHRVVDEVRKSVRTSSSFSPDNGDAAAAAGASQQQQQQQNEQQQRKQFGTSLCLIRNRVSDMLWKSDLNMVAMSEPSSPSAPSTASEHAEAARTMEIFLDYLSSQAVTGSSYLLNQAFDALLMDEQHTLADCIASFVDSVPQSARGTHEWARIAELLTQLGGKGLLEKKPSGRLHTGAMSVPPPGWALVEVNSASGLAAAVGGAGAGAVGAGALPLPPASHPELPPPPPDDDDLPRPPNGLPEPPKRSAPQAPVKKSTVVPSGLPPPIPVSAGKKGFDSVPPPPRGAAPNKSQSDV